jgi:hypothetical protein
MAVSAILTALLTRKACANTEAFRTIQVQDETIRHLREHIRDLNARIAILERENAGLESLF